MQIRNEEDFWSGAMFVVIGAGFAAAAQRFGMGTLQSMGPGWFPTAVGSIMAALGALLACKSLNTGEAVRIEAFGWRGIFSLLGALALFCLLLPYLGMIISLSLLVFGSSLASREFRLREGLLVTAALVVMGWVVFVVGLGVQVQVWPVFLGK
jgi:putative tricarboxylic transport membrane protein